MNSNDAGVERRLALIHKIVQDNLQVPALTVTPIAYEENFPFPYNNFVYVVTFDTRALLDDLQNITRRPGTHAIPATQSSIIIRLPNPLSGHNDSVRVENEVAALWLARVALQPDLSHLIPRVFAWESANQRQGWIMQEHMPGVPLSDHFREINGDDQAIVLGQMADVLAGFQRVRLPETVQGCGGLLFNESGSVICGPLSTLDGGPFKDYAGLMRGFVSEKLKKADSDPQVQGWRANGIRERLDRFLERGLDSLVEPMNDLKNVLVHADFSTDNVLYDPESKRLTAVLDFDFAHIAPAADEFFRSLGHDIGRFPDTVDENEKSLLALRAAMLNGFPNPLPAADDDVSWPAAKAWDTALRERNMDRPGMIPGMLQVADIYSLLSLLLPFRLCNEVIVSNSTPDQLRQRREGYEASIVAVLEKHGY